MELVVGALVVLAFIAILARFVFRDASGQVRLPRIVDESMGMWVIRRALGRPTDREDDPFARFRRPSTVLAPRPGDARRGASPRAATVKTPSVAAATASAAAVPTPGAPSVLRDASQPAVGEELAPAWSTIERPAPRGRTFGQSILEPATDDPRPRVRRLLQYAVLVVGVAVGGLAVGALAGVASGPNGGMATASPVGSASRALSPVSSSAPASPR